MLGAGSPAAGIHKLADAAVALGLRSPGQRAAAAMSKGLTNVAALLGLRSPGERGATVLSNKSPARDRLSNMLPAKPNARGPLNPGGTPDIPAELTAIGVPSNIDVLEMPWLAFDLPLQVEPFTSEVFPMPTPGGLFDNPTPIIGGPGVGVTPPGGTGVVPPGVAPGTVPPGTPAPVTPVQPGPTPVQPGPTPVQPDVTPVQPDVTPVPPTVTPISEPMPVIEIIVPVVEGPVGVPDVLTPLLPLPVSPNLPTTPSVSAVPEPQTWLMMLTGFLAIGGAIRRRRSAAGSAGSKTHA